VRPPDGRGNRISRFSEVSVWEKRKIGEEEKPRTTELSDFYYHPKHV